MPRLLNSIFWPISVVIERFGFRPHWMLLALLMPDAFVVFLLTRQSTHHYHFAIGETHGVAAITPLVTLLVAVEERRCELGTSDESRSTTLNAVMRAAIDDENGVQASYGQELSNPQFNTSLVWRNLAADLQTLVAEAPRTSASGATSSAATPAGHSPTGTLAVAPASSNPASAATSTTELLTADADIAHRILDLIQNYIANTSNLILDPDLDSYYLMDAYILKMPSMIDGIADAEVAARAILKQGVVSNEDRVAMASITSALLINRDGLLTDLPTAIRDNEATNEGRVGNRTIRPALADPITRFTSDVTNDCHLLHDQLLLADHPRLTDTRLAQLAKERIEACSAIERSAGPVLEQLCRERGERYRHTRTIGLITALLAGTSISYVFTGFTRAVARGRNELELRVAERTRELQQAQEELVRTAHRAGMAEIATNVLHNVGNVLNSVNVAVTSSRHIVTSSQSRRLEAMAQLLQAHEHDLASFLTTDAQGRHLTPFMRKLSGAIREERTQLLNEIAQLESHLDHIRHVIAVQQSLAHAETLLERVSVAALIEDALSMTAPVFTRLRIAPERVFDPGAGEIVTQRHKLLQILINLLRNAGEAVSETATGVSAPARVSVRLRACGADRIELAVCDTGAGIAPEHLPHLFTHGFSTKPQGHGFGLHSCALAARDLKGELRAHSDGPGRGATFTLELPRTP